MLAAMTADDLYDTVQWLHGERDFGTGVAR